MRICDGAVGKSPALISTCDMVRHAQWLIAEVKKSEQTQS